MAERKVRGSYQEIAVGVTDTVLLSANPHRKRLLIGNPTANALVVAFGRKSTAAQSFPITTTIGYLELTADVWGDLVGQEIHAQFTVGAGTVAILVGED